VAEKIDVTELNKKIEKVELSQDFSNKLFDIYSMMQEDAVSHGKHKARKRLEPFLQLIHEEFKKEVKGKVAELLAVNV